MADEKPQTISCLIGVSLGLISQRPSELSAQALSQCGTIFAMRLANELDHGFMEKVMPDAARGSLATLSSLGTQEAIVCGEGVPLPMRIRFDDLPRGRRPRSEGADFAKAWQTDSADAAFRDEGSAPLAAAEPQTPCNLRTLSIELTTCIARGRKRNIKRELVPGWGFPYLSCEGVVTLAAEVRAKRPRSADLAGKPALSWRRLAKFIFGAVLLAVAVLTFYQQLVVRVSRDAVINARLAVIRAPIDGVATASVTTPGSAMKAGEAVGRVEDLLADDARLAQLQREVSATALERDSLTRRLSDLERARGEAEAQAEAYRVGRVRQLELRIDEARANLAAAAAREADAKAAAGRGAALHARGFQSDEAQDKARHAQEVEEQGAIAARKRLDTLGVELDAARSGTFLGDSYNDAPSSLQRARELSLRITETQNALDEKMRKTGALQSELASEQERLAAHSKAVLAAPVEGRLWTVQAAPGEFVRKGQEILTVLDCSTVMVTASVSDRDYNELHLGDPVRFRVSGTDRDYPGRIVKLGSTTTFAIPSDPGSHQLAVVVPQLSASLEDGCAVGRTGEVTFDNAGRSFTARLTRSLRSLLNRS